jgi:hypothetical protein
MNEKSLFITKIHTKNINLRKYEKIITHEKWKIFIFMYTCELFFCNNFHQLVYNDCTSPHEFNESVNFDNEKAAVVSFVI